MPGLARFRALSPREKALVTVAVLLDGHDAEAFLQSDKDRSTALTRAAMDLAQLSPEVRMPLLGTQLRIALEDLEQSTQDS